MTVTFDLTMNDPGDPNYDAIYADRAQAATDWSRYFNSNATIRVQVDVGYFPECNAGLEVQNGPNDFVAVGTTASGKTIVEPWG